MVSDLVPPDPAAHKKANRSLHLQIIAGVLAVVAGTLGVYSAVVTARAVNAVSQREAAQNTADSLRQQNESLNATVETLERANATLRAEITQLGGPVDGAATGPSPGSANGSLSPVVRNKGRATIVDRGGVDLDSREANWGEQDRSREVDFSITRFSDPPLGATSAVQVSSGDREYSTCAAATGYSQDIFDRQIETGATFCVRTSDDRYSSIIITEVYQSSSQVVQSITLDIVTWE